MLEEMKLFIDRLKADKKIPSFDEAATKQAVILRLLAFLGWDTFNIDEVTPEYAVSGKRVDYSLRISNLNKVFIEVKRIETELDNHQEQLLNYSFQQGIKLAILTNGITWYFYLPLNEGSWEQRKFYTIDILQQNSSDIASKFEDFLSKENIVSGQAIQNAQAIYAGQQKKNILEQTLPKAWNKIVEEADDLLIELIGETTEKICGFKADTELIEHFLSKNKNVLLIFNQKESRPVLQTSPTPMTTGNYTGKNISSFYFRDSKYEVRSWKNLLIRLCEILSTNRIEFDKVLTIVGRKRPYFTRNANELRVPEKIRNTDIYVETNLSANSIVKFCFEVLAVLGYSEADLKIEAS
ncbi:MAG: type I restriction endonuclease [Candidatus Omnitrophota bacterium]